MKKLWAKIMLWFLYDYRMTCELGFEDKFLDKEDREYYKNDLRLVQARIKHYEGML